MRITSERFIPRCNCRSVGECSHATFAEFKALDALVDLMASELKKKLWRKSLQGKSGWDDGEWSIESIKSQLAKHVEKGDPIDVMTFALFWWNRLEADGDVDSDVQCQFIRQATEVLRGSR